ncbi:hypothetical protein ACCT14_34050 [Rhizobium brockwellii]|uniref:hypothetical protein n=2 Tax=Rhizobium brockwellii TaxID=3019932 RepID=UPI003F9D3772
MLNSLEIEPRDHTDLRTFAEELTGRLNAVAEIDPAALMDLFRASEGFHDANRLILFALQKFLLKWTVGHAYKHTKFYGKNPAYASLPSNEVDAAPDLSAWPIISRTVISENFEEFIADDVQLRSTCHTSGTTGQPMDVYKSFEEVRFINDYFSHMFRSFLKSGRPKPLSLSFPNFYHGVAVPMPSIGMSFVSGVTDDTLIQDARRVLDTTYHFKGYDSRIRILGGLGHHILFFTSYLMEQGVDLSTYRMECINLTGGFLSVQMFEFLRDAWKCPINIRFSMTETIGGATCIEPTSRFVLDPHLIGEVVDVDTGGLLQEGVGALVLTNLYPFVQMQPLIRYQNGDLVRRIPSANGRLVFDFLGRVKNALTRMKDGKREWLLFSAPLNNTLAAIPDIRVYDWFANVRTAKDRTVGSLPIMSVRAEERGGVVTIKLSLELRYAPHLHRKRCDKLRRDIIAAMRVVPDTVLSTAMDANEVVFDILFCGPEQLNEPIVIKI